MEKHSKPPTRMSKKELIEELVSYGYKAEELVDSNGDQLKRPDLAIRLREHRKGETSLEIFTELQEEDGDDDIGEEVLVEKISETPKDDQESTEPQENCTEDADSDFAHEEDLPTPHSPGWTQYVLGQFLDDEVDGQNPRVEGLRRVASLLVGELIEEGCDLVAGPTESNNYRACVKAWGVFVDDKGRMKRFEALADAHSENCLEDFATYLVAMADTRAKGRMFRNALHLRKVVAAEEVSKTVSTAADVQSGGSIHTGQISMIRLMSDRNNIKITDVLDKLNIQYEMNDNTGDVNLQSLSYEDALATSAEMRKIKEEKAKND